MYAPKGSKNEVSQSSLTCLGMRISIDLSISKYAHSILPLCMRVQFQSRASAAAAAVVRKLQPKGNAVIRKVLQTHSLALSMEVVKTQDKRTYVLGRG